MQKLKTISEKKGQAGAALWVIAAVGVVALLAWAWSSGQFAGGGDGGVSPSECADSTASLTFPAVNKYVQSTVVTPTTRVRIDGNTVVNGSAVSSYPVGADLEILYVLGNYIDDTQSFTVNCGQTAAPQMQLSATRANTFRIRNDDGDFMSDGGGATNQTNVAEGEAVLLEMEISGTDRESTGDMILVVEAGANANLSSITLSGDGVSPTEIPSFYADTLTGPKKAAFLISAIEGANKKTYTLGLNLNSGKDLTGFVYTTIYTQQAFEDVDGSYAVGIEDSDGTIKYEDTFDFDFAVDAA